MKKKCKPIPNVDCLKYHGTPEKPDIKIFVSHRIDQDSETIDNPLYIPVRCGAIFDDREGITMLGDNTGDNISEKRESYCELTVQYWAWKNIKADYYGLCHYRRYLSFGDSNELVSATEHDNGCVSEAFITPEVIEKHCLTEEKMSSEIAKYDLIAIEPIRLNNQTNYQAMQGSPDYHNMDDVDVAIDYIERKYPKMIPAVEEYMRYTDKSWLYNCWIMSAKLFEMYSNWLYDILFAIEKEFDDSLYSKTMYRTPGTIGERLFGIFITYIAKKKEYKINYKQLIFFKHTERYVQLLPFYEKNNIVVASNFNNNYVPAYSVLLQSILSHANTKYNYDFIVLSQDITNENKRILESMIKIPNAHLRFCNPALYLNSINLYVANAVYTNDMYVRVLIPYILANYKKVLVLDADMICKDDIANLYLTDLGVCWAGAVKDVVYAGYLNGAQPGTLEYTKKILKLKNPYNYCNTGVILLDCEKIRDKFSLVYLQNFISVHQYRIYEQDTLNVLLDTHFYFLDRSWNLYTYTNDFVEKCVSLAPIIDNKAYLAARKNPKCIHYASHPKPWWTGKGDFAIDFWEYARLSPFYESLVAEMVGKIIDIRPPVKTISYIPTPYKSIPRKVADIIMPIGSIRRKIAKKILPKGSRRWRALRSFYNRIMHIG